ncbi:MAG: DUF2834 domain-containing protein [Cyanothece sp. SIO2G6]|nr:DUF2834 domain-containing protein [Cyanothece sp. SIO2G6]
MMQRVGLWLLWIGLLIYSFGFAPSSQDGTMDLIVALSTFKWSGINPLVAALFSIMGLWPMVYAAVLLVDGRGSTPDGATSLQSVPAWPFIVLSFGLGAFALLPYLGLRRDKPRFSGPESDLIRLTESGGLAWLLLLSGAGLLLFGLIGGNWADFVAQWQTSRFIHVMSLDFCILSLLFVVLLPDDIARRQMEQGWLWGLIAFIPFLGPGLYLCWRSPLVDVNNPAVDLDGEPIVSPEA